MSESSLELKALVDLLILLSLNLSIDAQSPFSPMLTVPISPLPFSLPVLVRFLRPGLQSWSGSAIYNCVSPHLECLPVWFITVWFGVELSICYRSPSMVKVAEPSKPTTSSLFASYNIMLKRCPDSLQGVSPANTSCVISSFCLGATVWKLSCNLAR